MRAATIIMNSHDTATSGTTGQLLRRTSMKTEKLLTIPEPRLGQLQRLARKAPKCREDALALCSVLQALSPDERAQVHALVGLGRRKGYRSFKAALEAAKKYDLNLIPGMYCEDPTFKICLQKGLIRHAR